MNKTSLFSLALAAGLMLSGCEKKSSQEAELQARVDSLERELKGLSATELINNPNTANGQQVTAEGKTAAITFSESEHDFGNIKQGQVVTHTFDFKNTGDAPLIIENASASCGCTVPEYPKEPIAPGQSGKIKVRFDSQGKQGQQNKTVNVRANTQPNITTITVKSNVEVDNTPAAAGPQLKRP